MYIFELIAKLKTLKNRLKPTAQIEREPEELSCQHVFVPIDSLKENLACRKCGLMVKKKNLRKKKPENSEGNFFN